MTDLTQRLFERYSEEQKRAELEKDEVGQKVFASIRELLDFLSPSEIVNIPNSAAAKILEAAIHEQKKWSPNEAKVQWNLALNILRDEAISLRLSQ